MTKSGWVLALLALCGASLWAAPSGNTLFSVEYFYADNGMVTGRKINGDMQHYRYDKRGQLLSVTDAKGQILERYSYDPAGNILAKTIYGQTTTYIYDAANQLVSSTVDGRTTRYEYDAAGRLIKEGSKEYKYGYLDKVLAVQENGRITAAFDYHTDGQIAAAMTDKGDESFLWDGLALIRRNDTNLVNEPYATGGNPIVSGNDVLFNDMLGSTLGVKGQQNARVSMTAFGETNDPNAYFTGKPQVGELGYAFLFRNYRAEQGKWQSQDPMGYPDGWNNFTYVNNNVISALDPEGTCTVVLGVVISRCDVHEKQSQIFYGQETVYLELTCGCSTGSGAENPSKSITLGVKGTANLWGMTIPVDFSWNWSSPKHSIPAYVCSSSTHKANGGEHTVSFYTTPAVQMLFTKYACGRVDSEVISQFSKNGNRNKIMSKCE